MAFAGYSLLLSTLIVVLFVFSDETPTVTIGGPCSFNITGTENLTLTCNANGINVTDYIWGGLCISPTNTCTLVPRPEQNGGIVICTASDGITTNPPTGNCTLDLMFPPQNCSNETHGQPPELTEEGINISFIANPQPHSYTFSRTNHENKKNFDTEFDHVFNLTCSHISDISMFCELRQQNLSEEHPGSYDLKISNDLGTCNFPFQLEDKSKVLSPNDRDSSQDDEFRTYAVVLSGLMGVILLVVVIVAICATIKRQATPVKSSETVGVENGKDNAGCMSGVRATQPVCQPTEYQVTSFTNNKRAELGDFQQTRNHVMSCTENKKPEMVDSQPTSKEAMSFTDIMRLNGKYEVKCGEELCDEVQDGAVAKADFVGK